MGLESPWHWLILALVVAALFGYKRLPDASRSVGRSLRIFKTELKGMAEDDRSRDSAQPAQTVEVAPPVVAVTKDPGEQSVTPQPATERTAAPEPTTVRPADQSSASPTAPE